MMPCADDKLRSSLSHYFVSLATAIHTVNQCNHQQGCYDMWHSSGGW